MNLVYIPTIINMQQLQSQLNSIFADIYASLPGPGGMVSDVGMIDSSEAYVMPVPTPPPGTTVSLAMAVALAITL